MAPSMTISRRSLFAGALASASLAARPSRGMPATPDWADLAKLIGSPVLLPSDPRFTHLTQPENLAWYRAAGQPGAPMAVVRPSSAERVAKAIAWAADRGIPLAARSGGHSYAGCSSVPGLIINTESLRHVAFNPTSNLLEIGGGVLNGDIFTALQGLRPPNFKDGMAIVHGRCSGVGASAFLMGGGIGFDMRGHGAGCDLVESVDVALADGRVVAASATNNSDLFWAACGGGGGNLGIATGWRLRPFPVKLATAFTAAWKPGSDPRALLTRIIRRMEEAPLALGAQITVGASRGGQWPASIRIVGLFRGSWAELNAQCPGLLEGTNGAPAYDEGAYWDVQEFLDQLPVPNRYQETSLFTGLLTDAGIDALFGAFSKWPGKTAAARITLFRTGGKMNAMAPDANAFVHRQSEWLANTSMDWDECDNAGDVADGLQWQRDTHTILDQAMNARGSYQNFPDPGLANHGSAYWGSNLKRLTEVKLKYDPKFVFTPPQNQAIVG